MVVARAICQDSGSGATVDGPSGARAIEVDREQLEELVLSPAGLLRAFKPLTSGRLHTIGVVPLDAHQELPVRPFRVHPRWLARGCARRSVAVPTS